MNANDERCEKLVNAKAYNPSKNQDGVTSIKRGSEVRVLEGKLLSSSLFKREVQSQRNSRVS